MRPTPFPNVPGPRPFPALGAVPRLIAYARDPIGETTRLFARYGNIVALAKAPARIATPTGIALVFVTGADLNREILTHHDRYHMYALPSALYPEDATLERARARHRSFGRATAERLLPIRRTLTGLFHVNGDEHRRHKRLLLPSFHKTRIDAYRDDMVRLTDAMLARWQVGETRDVLTDLTRLTLRIATTTLFGADVGERGVSLAEKMQEWLVTMFQPAMVVPLDLPLLPYRRWLDLTRAIDDETVALLRDKQAQVARAKVEGAPTGRDMLSMLLEARDEDGSALDEDDLVGHVGVIFAAGHETSTNALAWTLFLLATHPAIANALVEELRAVLRGEPPTVEDLARLPLLDRVVKESLRVLPPVPLHPRVVAEDHDLAGHHLPRRTELILSIFHLHHDPALFPEPRRFSPERWATIKPTAFEYNPFSAGPRMCIGAAFATMEIKIVLAMLLQRFRLELAEGARIDRRVAITLAPKHGMPMRVHGAASSSMGSSWTAPRARVRGDVHELVELPA